MDTSVAILVITVAHRRLSRPCLLFWVHALSALLASFTLEQSRFTFHDRMIPELQQGCWELRDQACCFPMLARPRCAQQTNLLAYDAEENSDVFFKEVPDGVNAIAFGCVIFGLIWWPLHSLMTRRNKGRNRRNSFLSDVLCNNVRGCS